ncbi:hypothetical protein E2C01_092440 [Portunus trituberculatus]|uniref:Uncharacterized protein n=1 Tax=Portunus trituberculatus TaxID=210409 RepID=A0A5B7JS23_PORTR|nr:hypothetical protein [Portunus trituberculatus]
MCCNTSPASPSSNPLPRPRLECGGGGGKSARQYSRSNSTRPLNDHWESRPSSVVVQEAVEEVEAAAV